jgi:peptide deformylase
MVSKTIRLGSNPGTPATSFANDETCKCQTVANISDYGGIGDCLVYYTYISMAKLSIVTYPEKILKRRAGTIQASEEIRKLILLMIEAMYNNEGIGLAAPQIGVSKRIIIIETSHEPRKTLRQAQSKLSEEGKPLAFLNPELTELSEELQTEEEGCLSLPGIFVPVTRPAKIKLTCQDEHGKEIKLESGGLIARIFQHEIDHLQGKLIIDHLSIFKKLKLHGQLKQIARQHT